MLRTVFNSPVLTTWLALSIRAGGGILIIPLVLRQLSPSDTTLWLLFSTIAGLQLLVDFGFSQTFSRFVAYAYAGKDGEEVWCQIVPSSEGRSPISSRESLGATARVMAQVYRYLAAATLVLLLSAGTWAVAGPIRLSTSPEESWVAWALVIVSTTFSIYGNRYVAHLIGANHIALQKRWDTLVGGGLFIAQALALYLQGTLLGLVAVSQAWIVISFFVNRWLYQRCLPAEVAVPPSKTEVELLFNTVWSSAWRSAMGIGLGFGVMRISSVVFANVLPSGEAASFLLGLRMMQMLSQFSQVPFYTKLPVLAGYRLTSRIRELEDLAATSMQRSYWIYVAGFGLLGLIGPAALKFVGSQTAFPSGLFWAILGAGILAERFGAMHLQLFSTTNRIVWHKANGMFSVGFILLLFGLVSSLGDLAYPVALSIANIGLYGPYSARHSYSALIAGNLEFERRAAFMPALCFVALCVLTVVVHG